MTDQTYPPKRPNMAHFETSEEQKIQDDRQAHIGGLVDDHRNRYVLRPHPDEITLPSR